MFSHVFNFENSHNLKQNECFNNVLYFFSSMNAKVYFLEMSNRATKRYMN
jgi:hypothetical protein